MRDRIVKIGIGDEELEGNLSLPEGACGLVVFAHGSGSSRFSPRNRFVASALEQGGLGTLLFDLLTPEEERIDAVTGELRFDIEFLAQRLIEVTNWVSRQELVPRGCGLGLFGSSTGAAAARDDGGDGPVEHGGRPDLAGEALLEVRAPSLLIVGGRDVQVLHLNQRALAMLPGDKRLEIIPGATHLFEEPGALEKVAALARDWFVEYLGRAEVSLPGGEPARSS
jgi:hypothetical protein